MFKAIETEGAPGCFPYSQAIRAGDFLFVSGQGPLDPDTCETRGENIREQTRLTLDNVKAIVEAAGLSLSDVVKVIVVLADQSLYDDFNEVYLTYFSQPLPCRLLVVAGLFDIMVEVDVVAYAGGK